MDKQSAQQGVISPPVIVGGIIALVAIFFLATGNFKFSASVKPNTKDSAPPSQQEQQTPTPAPDISENKVSLIGDVPEPSMSPQVANKKAEDNWQTYQSEKYGYTVTYPLDWQLFDGNTDTSRRMLIKDNANLGYVDIQSFFDKTLKEPGKLQEALDALEAKFRRDADLKVAQFKSSVEGKIGGYITTGEQTLRGELYNYENRGLLATSGKILLFHGAYKKSTPKDYLQKIEKIITSFRTD